MESIYCLRCKKKTDTNNITQKKTKDNRNMVQGTCVVCNTKKSKFIILEGGKLVDDIIDKMPEMHLPNHNYTGPFTKLSKKLDKNDKPLPGYEPYNQVDAVSLKHDICYRDTPKFEDKNKICDKKMLDELKAVKPMSIREYVDKKIVHGVIGLKKVSGLG